MKRLPRVILFAAFCLTTTLLTSSEEATPTTGDWTGTVEQRVSGLATIWAEAKYAFPSFSHVPDLDWDRSFREFIPKVLAAKDKEAYYWTLMSFAALLDDGHTSVLPPWGHLRSDYDNPPLEVHVIGAAFIVARVGATPETNAQAIRPGLEILEIDGVRTRAYFDNRVNCYYPRGSVHANDSVNVVYLLRGPRDSQVNLKVQDEEGRTRDVTLTRNATLPDGRPFLPRLLLWMMADSPMETRRLEGGVQYVRLANFEHPEMADAFLGLIDSLDRKTTKGLLLDMRFCLGGRSDIAERMIGALIDAPVSSPHWRYPCYVEAERNWGRPTEWRTKSRMIPVRDGKRFDGPVVILTAGTASSTAEDFMISLRENGRTMLVGERTAGIAGNPVSLALPGGGTFNMATFHATLPDGGEYVGIGLEPDVEIAPTRQDIQTNVDSVLKKGLDVLMAATPGAAVP